MESGHFWQHLGDVAGGAKPLALTPLGSTLGIYPRIHPRVPAVGELGVRTILKSRCSLVYCHMLPRRLAAALEDFSLSELGQGWHSEFWVPLGMGAAQGCHPEGPGGYTESSHLSLLFLM